MANQMTPAELIADAREAAKRADWYMTGESPLLRALADALEAAERERDNWKLSAEEAERAEKRWRSRAEERKTND